MNLFEYSLDLQNSRPLNFGLLKYFVNCIYYLGFLISIHLSTSINLFIELFYYFNKKIFVFPKKKDFNKSC